MVVVGRRGSGERIERKLARRLRQDHLEVGLGKGTRVALFSLPSHRDADRYRRRRVRCIVGRDVVGDVQVFRRRDRLALGRRLQARLERVAERQTRGAGVQRIPWRESKRPVAVASGAAASGPVVPVVLQRARRRQRPRERVLERRRRVNRNRLEGRRRRIPGLVTSGRLTHLPPFPDGFVVDRGRSRAARVVLEGRVLV